MPGRKYKQSSTAREYLDQRLDKSGDCWEFTFGKDRQGYGQCHASRVAKELGVTRAHQMAYVDEYGPVPEGRMVCHHCDNPSCCNPEHLYAGTPKDNVQDCLNRGRYRNGAKPTFDHDYILRMHGEKSSMTLSKELGCSFSLICLVWRAHGLTGRHF